MKKYGVIGYPVLQSFSPQYFAEKFQILGLHDFIYEAIEVEDISTIRSLIQKGEWDGLNVTIPHKQSVIPYLDGLSDLAVKLNAVNTIKLEGQKLMGYNTDYYGFSTSLTRVLSKEHSSALIFGSGGSSLAVRFALRKLGIDYKLISRGAGGDLTYSQLTNEIVAQHKILINTTPLGMYPNLDEAVNIPYEGIGVDHLCFDLVYNPSETVFLYKCKLQGAQVKNGREMLELQADKSWDIWNM